MRREAGLKHRLRSLQTLRSAVSAMKSLSAHHFRETRRAVEPAHLYRDGVDRVVARTGASIGAGVGPPGLLVVGGELGLCGAYNARIVAAALARRTELGPGPTLCVGHRAAAMLARRGVRADIVYAAPMSLNGITEMMLRLAEDLLGEYVRGRLSSFDIVSSTFNGVGDDPPTVRRLLPLDAAPSAGDPPSRYVSPGDLQAAAVRELLYITLYDMLIDALACEHSARLVATQGAEQWLDERSTQVGRQLAATRRESRTQEVLEIAAGARARRPPAAFPRR